jgi:hypothetical protein
MYDLSVDHNNLIGKIIDRSLREKDHPTGNFKDKEQLMALRDAKDLEPIMSDAGDIKSIHVGGATAVSFNAHTMMQDLVNRAGQNSDVIGGVSQQAETLGQESMMQSNAGIKFSDLKKTDMDFLKSICWKAAHYLWNDVVAEFEVTTYSSGDITITEQWSSSYREGELEDYDISLELYNEDNDSPDAQYANGLAILNEFMLPLAPIAQQQGKSPNIDALTEVFAGAKGFKSTDLWISAPILTPQPQQDISIDGDTITNNQGNGKRLDQFKAPEIAMSERK